MKNKKTIKNIIIALVVAIVLVGVYAAITSNNEDGAISTSSLSSLTGGGPLGKVDESDTTLANAEILRILGNIQNINLNDDLFANPVFQSLEDSRFVIPKPVRIGRPNPFLPIGFDSIINPGIEETFVQEETTNFFTEGEDTILLDENGQVVVQ